MRPSKEAVRLVRLFRLARLAAGASLAPILAGTFACTSGVSRSGFDQSVCTQTGRRPLVGVRFRENFDFVELRQSYSGTTSYSPADTVGEACKTATRPDSCTRDLEGVSGGVGWTLPSSGDAQATHYLVATRGDEVTVVRTLGELDTLVAPVESVADAALLASERGYNFDCEGDPLGKADGEDFLLIAKTGFACGEGTHEDEHLLRVNKAGAVTVVETRILEEGSNNCAIGRRPEGFEGTGPCSEAPLAAYLEAAASLEEASIVAFERFALELERFEAPKAFARLARRAAKDEVRHTAMTKRMARRFGGSPRAPSIAPTPPRSLLAFACENAREGCVRETFGALVAHVQSERAKSADLREAFEAIANDETEHAALAWKVHAWLGERLDEEGKRRVRDAMDAATQTLAEELREEANAEVRFELGVPSATDSIAMFRALDAGLWSAERALSRDHIYPVPNTV